MTVLTVRAPDSAQAMEEVLRRLGPDAYILSTRQSNGQVEIHASSHLPPPAPVGQTFGEMLEERRRSEAERPAAPLVAERRWPPAPPKSPRIAVPAGSLAETLLLPAAALPQRIVIAGPPGAGKTLLTLRFAALMMAEQPGCAPLMLAPRADLAGPDPRLRHWARLLDLGLERPTLEQLLHDPGWQEALAGQPQIIDLSGAATPEAGTLAALAQDGLLVLALPAGLSPRQVAHHADRHPGAVVCLTRTDLWSPEAAELRALAEAGLTLGWVAGGSGVIDALVRAEAQHLSDWAADWPEDDESGT